MISARAHSVSILTEYLKYKGTASFILHLQLLESKLNELRCLNDSLDGVELYRNQGRIAFVKDSIRELTVKRADSASPDDFEVIE